MATKEQQRNAGNHTFLTSPVFSQLMTYCRRSMMATYAAALVGPSVWSFPPLSVQLPSAVPHPTLRYPCMKANATVAR